MNLLRIASNKGWLITSFLIIIVLNACNSKDCDCDNSFKKVPEKVKEWFWFNEGSQWIYQLKEDTTVKDTLTLIHRNDLKSNKFCSSDFSNAVACSEILTTALQHSNGKHFPRTTKDSINAGKSEIIAYTPHGGGEFLKLIWYEMTGSFLGFPLTLEENYDRYTLKDTMSNFSLVGNTYANVIYSEGIGYDGSPKGAEIWWAKDVGLLKIRNNIDSITWELIDYKIK